MELNYLKTIFNYFDTDKDGNINGREYKQLINIMNLPVPGVPCNTILYTFDDVCNYVKISYIFDHAMFINKKHLEKELLINFDNNTTKFIIQNMLNNKK
jgi:hypothetical protein